MLKKELQGLEKQIEECLTTAYMKGYNEGRNETDYLRGLEDAWKCATDIYNMPCDKVIAIFGGVSYWVKNTPSEAIAKIKKYELTHRPDEDINVPAEVGRIKIGDEVCAVDDSSIKFIVIDVDTLRDRLTGYSLKGVYSNRPMNHWRRTGRHFSEIEEVAKKLENESEEEK